MSNLSKEEPCHTYLDDIKYQIVKANNKRTSFVSSDQLIVAKSQQILRGIEKNERLVSSEYRRQQSAMLNKLNKLQEKQSKLGTMSNGSSDGYAGSRRHSAPSVRATIASTPTCSSPKELTFLTKVINAGEEQNGNSNSSSPSPYGSRQSLNRSPMGSRMSMNSSPMGSRTSLSALGFVGRESLHEARRQSAHEIQAETNKMARVKFESIMKGNYRRATIAECATSTSYIPTPGDLSRLHEIAARSLSIEEESG